MLLGCSTITDDDKSDQLASIVAAESERPMVISADANCARYNAKALDPMLCLVH